MVDEVRDKDNRLSTDTELEVLDREDKGNEQYFAIVKDIIHFEKVDRAVIPEQSDSMFGTSRVSSKSCWEILDKVWKTGNVQCILMYRESTAFRYKIMEDDFESYLTPARLDTHLKHELSWNISSFKSKDPKLPDKHENALEGKLWTIERHIKG